MKENGVVRRRLSGKEADPYIGLARKILGEMKNIMRLGGIQQLSWTKNLQNGVRIVVSSIFGQDEININVPLYMPESIVEELSEEFETSIFKIIGAYSIGTMRYGFLWSDGVMQTIGTEMQPAHISMDGKTVVGLAGIAAIGQNHYTPFKWTERAGIELLQTPGYAAGWGTGVSWNGRNIAGYGIANPAAYQAFKWDSESKALSLGSGKYTHSQAWGISLDGNVVVGHTQDAAGSTIDAFRWTKDEGIKSLGLPTSGNNFARRCSKNGSVIVGYAWRYTDVISGAEAFYWDESTGIHYMGALNGHYTSRAHDVSSDGSVIVGESTSLDDGLKTAFKWTKETGMVALASPSGGSAVARAITADGRLICGDFVYSSGYNVPCYWDEQGQFIPIALPANAVSGGASGITNAKFDKNGIMIQPE